MIILEEFSKNHGEEYPSMDWMPDDEKYKLQFLQELLKNAEITRPEQVDYYLDYRNIIDLMS